MNAVQTRNRRKKYAQKKPNPVIVEDYYFMGKVFPKNHWTSYPGFEGILQAHTNMMRKMNDDQKHLFLDLTSRFLWIRDYTWEIIQQLNKIIDQCDSYKTYYVMRCMKKNEEKISKSSGYVLYEIKGPEVMRQLHKPLHILYTFKEFIKVRDFNNSLLILVDDYLGSGKTAEDCLKHLIKLKKDIERRIVVMCIAASPQGINLLSSLHVPVFAGYYLKRGISDYYKGAALVQNTQLMKQMESLLHISDPNFTFGFAQSEALVCLKRCPNNTFPIYWHGRNSPYPRY